MAKFKFKLGDRVTVIASRPVKGTDDGVEHHIGKSGTVVMILTGDNYPYRVQLDGDEYDAKCFNVRELDFESGARDTVQERIIARIYKLYAKCPTTKHWVREEKISA